MCGTGFPGSPLLRKAAPLGEFPHGYSLGKGSVPFACLLLSLHTTETRVGSDLIAPTPGGPRRQGPVLGTAAHVPVPRAGGQKQEVQ